MSSIKPPKFDRPLPAFIRCLARAFSAGRDPMSRPGPPRLKAEVEARIAARNAARRRGKEWKKLVARVLAPDAA